MRLESTSSISILGHASRKFGQDGGQHLHPHDLAGGQAHGAGHLLGGALGGADQGLGGDRHGLGVRRQRLGRAGGQKAAGRAGEQRLAAQGAFQGFDVAAHRRLGDAERAGGAGEAARLHHRQERAVEIPVRFTDHAIMYIDRTNLDNSE